MDINKQHDSMHEMTGPKTNHPANNQLASTLLSSLAQKKQRPALLLRHASLMHYK